MTLRIGRWGLDAEVDNPRTYMIPNAYGVTMGGEFIGASLAASQASQALLRQTFGGDEGPPDPVVAFYWSEDDHAIGYVRPVRCSISYKPLTLQDWSWEWQVELERLPTAQASDHTVRSWSRERTGAGTVSEMPWLAVPSDVKWLDLASGSTDVYYTRTGPGGSVRFYPDTGLASGVSTYRIDPADWGDMRPFVKVNGYEQAGPDVASIGNGDDWELGNGIVHFRGASAATHTLRLRGPVGATPASWGTDYSIIIAGYLSGTRTILRPDHVEVLGCTVEAAGIRLTGGISTAATNDDYRISCDLWLRRGGMYAEGVVWSARSMQHSIKDLAAASLTSVTANKTARSTSNDGDGNRLWIASGTTLNETNIASGELYANASAKQLPFGLGIELNGSSSVAPNTVAEQFLHYWADQTNTIEIGG